MKDSFCSYYTNSKDITSYMVSMLNLIDGDVLLEPAVGEGAFVQEILGRKKKITIDAVDIDINALNVLKHSVKENFGIDCNQDFFSSSIKKNKGDIRVGCADSLLNEQLDFFAKSNGFYTKVVGNPPYGAWQDLDRRTVLKKKYDGAYVKETYSLFLLRCISLLKDGGVLSFIIPDTFLFLNMHTKLRKFILNETKIREILIFPSKFFPGISFGYSNLSIITLEKNSVKQTENLNNRFKVFKGFQSTREFSLVRKASPKHVKKYQFKQSDVLKNDNHRLLLTDNQPFVDGKVVLGDVADIVTGFYSGDNKKFIRVANESVKGSKGYDVVDLDKVYNSISLNGVDKDEAYVPYIKSSSQTKYCRLEGDWFVRWDKATIQFYNENKKSRFQNSSFYFKKGIGMPMVKSSVIRAFLMEGMVFDQSIVGIFPKDANKFYYLLALMNSDIVNELIHVINPTANNSSNYVKRIPYLEPNNKEDFDDISEKTKNIFEAMKKGDLEKARELHELVNGRISGIYKAFSLSA